MAMGVLFASSLSAISVKFVDAEKQQTAEQPQPQPIDSELFGKANGGVCTVITESFYRTARISAF